MCPALTVSKLLHTLPSSCGTSRMKINTNCSFTCPRGYQLKGPSYKQCSVDGQWSDESKKVSCTGESWNFRAFYQLCLPYSNQRLIFADIDECSLPNNGGCSHKCINTMGSYKCQCPDLELTLSPDNKTCRGNGIILNRYSWYRSQKKEFSTKFLLQQHYSVAKLSSFQSQWPHVF